MTATKKSTAPQTKSKVAAATNEAFNGSFIDRLHANMSEFFGEYEVPSPKRMVTAFVLSVVAGCATWYVAAPFIGLMFIAIELFTGSAFLGFVALVLGIIATWYAAAKVGAFVYDVVSAQVLERGVRRVWAPMAERIAEWKSDRAFFAARGAAR